MKSNALSLANERLGAELQPRLHEIAAGLSTEQLMWVSGYFAGLAAGVESPPEADKSESPELTILYGSQTGNGRSIATRLESEARSRGLAVKRISMGEFSVSRLKKETHLLCIVSTHGEGDPPDSAHSLFRTLHKRRSPRLENLRYSVLALGDSSYEKFCEAGRRLDRRLEELGARRILNRVECDVDFDESSSRWIGEALDEVEHLFRLENPSTGATGSAPALRAVEALPRYDRNHPFAAEVLVNQKITGRGSCSDVRHLELSLEGSELEYEPGDAIGVLPTNPAQVVRELLEALSLDPGETVSVAGETVAVSEALARHFEITVSSRCFLERYAPLVRSDEIDHLLLPEHRSKLAEFLHQRQVTDIVREYPSKPTAAEFTACLRHLTPRLYSVASCLEENPEEAHLTVARVSYERFGYRHWGSASTFLCDSSEDGNTVPVFVEANPRFHLPPDDTTPILMVGTGTGIAPYRGFLQLRKARGATGPNWLLFGHRHFESDFLYQTEWQRHLADGTLARLDLAFSRDQEEKIYVQNRLIEHGREVYSWLRDGAHFYVCGDASHMAPAVHTALAQIVADNGGLSSEQSEEFLDELLSSGRYHRDVY